MAADTINQFVGSGTAAEMAAYVPDPPVTVNPPDCGFVYYNTTDGLLYAWDGAAWVSTGGGGGGITELTGDVTAGPGSGSEAATIANNAVTTAKIANANVTLGKIANAAANSKLLGSGASGSGASYDEITLGTNLSMSGTTLNAVGGSGSGVTSVVAASDESVANNTLQDDNELFFSVAANAVYRFKLVMFVTTGTSSGVDGQLAMTLPAGSSASGVMFGLSTAAVANTSLFIYGTVADATPSFNAFSFGVISTASVPACPVVLEGVIVTSGTSGTAQMQFSQDVTTGGTPIVRKAGSFIDYWQVS